MNKETIEKHIELCENLKTEIEVLDHAGYIDPDKVDDYLINLDKLSEFLKEFIPN